MSRAKEILDFWFGIPDEPGYGKPKAFWFKKTHKFDEELRSRFLKDYLAGAAGHLDEWIDFPDTSLALILLLDQIPRNIFRGTPQAYATDWEALSAASRAVALRYDQKLLPVQRWFIYLPFEHSENLDHQRKAVQLFQQLSLDPDSASCIDYAIRHKSVIERFGRFPHRNAILGRASTLDEQEFLKQAGSSF